MNRFNPDPGTRRVSLNESTALLKRAFEGLGLPAGACQEAADMVVWAQACGLQGFAELLHAWPELESTGYFPPEPSGVANGVDVLDARGGSVLFTGPSAMDLACCRDAENGPGIVDLLNCRHPVFILKYLTDCARQGHEAHALWTGEHDTHLASCQPSGHFPQYHILPGGSPDGSGPLSLRVICGAGSDLPDHHGSKSHDLALGHADALQNGMEASEELWSILTGSGERVLVAASEQSRMGAGE